MTKDEDAELLDELDSLVIKRRKYKKKEEI